MSAPLLPNLINPWLVYPTQPAAIRGVSEIDDKLGYPLLGTSADTGKTSLGTQMTLTWAEPRQREDGMWCFPAPADDYLPSQGEIDEYDPSWFPPPEAPA